MRLIIFCLVPQKLAAYGMVPSFFRVFHLLNLIEKKTLRVHYEQQIINKIKEQLLFFAGLRLNLFPNDSIDFLCVNHNVEYSKGCILKSFGHVSAVCLEFCF